MGAYLGSLMVKGAIQVDEPSVEIRHIIRDRHITYTPRGNRGIPSMTRDEYQQASISDQVSGKQKTARKIKAEDMRERCWSTRKGGL